jgi:2-dehydropantoate 2-reductase
LSAARVLVVGAGGVGGYYAARLARAGHEVSVVARGAHAEAIRQRGLEIAESGGSWRAAIANAVTDPASLGAMDAILVCVKSYDTVAAARLLAPCLGPETIVLSLQNGVENEEILAREARTPPLMVAVTYIGSQLAAPGVIAYSGEAELVFGEVTGERSARAERLSAWLAAAELKHRISEHILHVAWDKLAWNAAFNPITALTRTSVREVLSGDGAALIREAMAEVFAVAHGLGIDVPARIDASIARSRDRLPDFHTSMLQDLERGHRLEVDALNGAVVRAGHRAGVATPLHSLLLRLVSLADRARPHD